MNLNLCPFCNRPLPNPDHTGKKQDIVCPSCGAVLCRDPELCLPYGERLPSTPLKKNRVACPYCKAHYSLNYEPAGGLVGCQACLKVFILPKESSPSRKEPINIPVNAVNTGEIPIRRDVIPEIPIRQDVPPVTPPTLPATPVRNAYNDADLQDVPLSMLPPINRMSQSLPPIDHSSPVTNGVNFNFRSREGSGAESTKCSFRQKAANETDAQENNQAPAPASTLSSTPALQLLGDVLWLATGGLVTAVGCCISGVLLCLTIIGIPFGLQLFKFSRLELAPFSSYIDHKKDAKGEVHTGCLTVGMNILWLLLGGLFNAFFHLLIGLLLCLTIIGIPFGLQHFKLARLMLSPFGLVIQRREGAFPFYITIIAAVILMILFGWIKNTITDSIIGKRNYTTAPFQSSRTIQTPDRNKENDPNITLF